jgi:Holliday junction DNA helicase RuvA
MIGFLRGKVIEVGSDTAIINVGGVGYEINASQNTLINLTFGAETQVWVHTHVREDAITLFGFLQKIERQMFLSLLKVNGVGPKMGIKILSGASLEQLVSMIENSDVKGLSSLPKVGKKTAKQIILTLKGKLVIEDEDAPVGPRGQIISALVNLGFKISDVEKVVKSFDVEIEVEEGVRQGLQRLTTL